MQYTEIKAQVLDTVHKLCDAGLIQLSSGNVSARHAAGYLAITPTSIAYDQLTADDIVVIDLDGRVVEGHHQPSSEWPMHTALMRARPEIGAIVHTHSTYAIVFAVLGREIPAVCVEGAFVGDAVPVAHFATPGTVAAAEEALEALDRAPGVKATLLSNHGLVAIGANLATAWETAYRVEMQAQVYHLALQIGHPRICTPQQVAAIQQRYMPR